MPLGQTIPALPVQDMAVAVKWYADKLGFTAGFADQEFAVLRRDDSVIHLWLAADESWKHRTLLGQRPIESGAESFLAGTASCRIQVSGSGMLDRLFEELAAAGVLHGCQSSPQTTDFGAREFHAVDLEGNLFGFFEWLDPTPTL